MYAVSAFPAEGTFRILAGQDALREWKPESGGYKYFCGVCGSQVYANNPSHADPIGIRMGSFDDDPGIEPSVHQFTAYAAAWDPIPADGLPRFPRSRHA